MIWGTESPGRIALLMALLLLAAPAGVDARDRKDPVRNARDLEDILEDAEKGLSKAEKALRGKDPGRVSRLLRGTEEQIARFEKESGLEFFIAELIECGEAARQGDLDTARDALRRTRPTLLLLSDYSVTRDAEVGYRLALRAAELSDPDGYLEALARLESAVLAPVLLRHVQGAREAIARGRAAMVRRDMDAGRDEAAAARRSLEGLRFASAMSQSVLGIQVAAEMLRDDVRIAARDQARKGLRKLRVAIALAPEAARAPLKQALSEGTEIWRRMSRSFPDDATRLEEISRVLEAIRHP